MGMVSFCVYLYLSIVIIFQGVSSIPTLMKENIKIKWFETANLTFENIYAYTNKFVFTYSCLTNFLQIVESVKDVNKVKLNFIFIVNFLLQFIIVSGIGVAGYLQIAK